MFSLYLPGVVETGRQDIYFRLIYLRAPLNCIQCSSFIKFLDLKYHRIILWCTILRWRDKNPIKLRRWESNSTEQNVLFNKPWQDGPGKEKRFRGKRSGSLANENIQFTRHKQTKQRPRRASTDPSRIHLPCAVTLRKSNESWWAFVCRGAATRERRHFVWTARWNHPKKYATHCRAKCC